MKWWIYLFVFLFLVSFGYAENNGCCLLTSAGDSCVYTTENNCAEDFFNGVLCENTDSCRTGCCISEEGCFEETADYTCSLNSGEFFDDQICSAFETCQMTCCKVGTDYSFMNSGECQALIDEYGSDVVGSYSASDEAACEELEDQEQTGCCVTTSGCSMGTQAECGSSSYNSEGFGFFENEYCDSVSYFLAEKDYIAKDYCACEVSSEPVCDSDGLNIVEVDSCGNYGEVVETCDYPDEICIDNNGVAECSPGSCYFELSEKLVSYNPLWQNNFRNLESRCLYEGPAGNYQDLPGSRHYVIRCLAGEVVLEPCDDYREQVCVDSYVDDFDWAECVGNNVDSEEELVTTVPIGQKFWEDYTSGEDSSCSQAEIKCETIFGEGVKGAATDTAYECDANCFCLRREWSKLMNEYCKAQGDCGNDINLAGELDTGNFNMKKSLNQINKGNADSIKHSTTIGCGESCLSGAQGSIEDARGLQCYPGGSLAECHFYKWDEFDGTYFRDYFDSNDKDYKERLLERTTGSVYLFTMYDFAQISPLFFRQATEFDPDKDGNPTNDEDATFEILTKVLEIDRDSLSYFYGYTGDFSDLWNYSSDPISHNFANPLYSIDTNNYYTWNKSIENYRSSQKLEPLDYESEMEYIISQKFALHDVTNAYAKAPEYSDKVSFIPVTVSSVCGSWVAPTADDCELCTTPISEGGLAIEVSMGNVFSQYSCSEYRCKALGVNCEYIEENFGTSRSSCVNLPPDENSPVITLWEEKMKELGYDYKKQEDGVEIFEVPVGMIQMPVLTDEYAQCKISEYAMYEELLADGTDGFFEELDYISQEPLLGFSLEHNFTYVFTEGGTEYKFFIFCNDYYDNPTLAPYEFHVFTSGLPDTDAPEIEGIYPNSGEYVKADEIELDLTVYLNENAFCKYSSQDLLYEQMTSEFVSCSSSDEIFNYVCITTIPLSVGTTNLYILCSDISGNIMSKSEYWTIAQSLPLEITQTSPSETLYTNEIVLQVNTKYGADNGNAVCYAEGAGFPYQKLFFSGGTYHEQSLNLEKGSYSYAITCEDELGNTATSSIDFIVDKDVSAAEITGVYYLGTNIYVLTNEATTCQYKTESFSYGNGYDMGGVASEAHSFSVSDFTSDYYVNCIDAYSNVLEGVKINLQYLI